MSVLLTHAPRSSRDSGFSDMVVPLIPSLDLSFSSIPLSLVVVITPYLELEAFPDASRRQRRRR